jgi:hypothetical protein
VLNHGETRAQDGNDADARGRGGDGGCGVWVAKGRGVLGVASVNVVQRARIAWMVCVVGVYSWASGYMEGGVKVSTRRKGCSAVCFGRER